LLKQKIQEGKFKNTLRAMISHDKSMISHPKCMISYRRTHQLAETEDPGGENQKEHSEYTECSLNVH
jgi:hypothetical protein